MDIKNKIIMAYAKSYEYYTDDFSEDGVGDYYVFDTPEDFINEWIENGREGWWYWVFDNGNIVCSGALDPDDIEIFEDYWGIEVDCE